MMGNEFFENHPMLGSVFDLDHDGSLSFAEAALIGSFANYYEYDSMRAAEQAEREIEGAYRDDDDDDDDYGDDDDDDPFESSDTDYERDNFTDFYDVDTSRRKDVVHAVASGEHDTESLVEEALDNGVRFKPEDIISLSYRIYDQDLLVRLISTSKPRFLQEHADELSPRWGPVELEYHEEAFNKEYRDGNTYHVNTPEEDW